MLKKPRTCRRWRTMPLCDYLEGAATLPTLEKRSPSARSLFFERRAASWATRRLAHLLRRIHASPAARQRSDNQYRNNQILGVGVVLVTGSCSRLRGHPAHSAERNRIRATNGKLGFIHHLLKAAEPRCNEGTESL